ncbi:hypothetical protein OROHE_010310 [Orobanche hederae]
MLRNLLDTSTAVSRAKGKRKSKPEHSDSGEKNLSKKDLALKQALDQITTAFEKGLLCGLVALSRQMKFQWFLQDHLLYI